MENEPAYDSSVTLLEIYLNSIFPIQPTYDVNGDGFDSYKDTEGLSYVLVDPNNQNVPESETTNRKYLVYSNPSVIDDIFRVLESPPQDLLNIFQNLNKTWYLDQETNKIYYFNGNILVEHIDDPVLQAGLPSLSSIKRLFSELLVKLTQNKKLSKILYSKKIPTTTNPLGEVVPELIFKNGKVIVTTGTLTTATILMILPAFLQTPLEIGKTVLELQGIMLFTDFICEEAIQSAGMGVFIAKGSRDIECMKTSVENYKKVLALSKEIHKISGWNIAKPAFDAFLQASENNIIVYDKLVSDSQMKFETARYTTDAGWLQIYTAETCNLYINGIRNSQKTPTSIRLNPGQYHIKIERSDSIAEERDVVMVPYGVVMVGDSQNIIVLKKKAKVTLVIDGDTIVINNDYHVRLLGFNAPELSTPEGIKARQFLSSMINGYVVELEDDIRDEDDYGRKLRWVYFGDILVNAFMLKNGMGTLMPGEWTKHMTEMMEAENSKVIIPEKIVYAKGTLIVNSETKFSLLVDGNYKGSIPGRFKISAGNHSIVCGSGRGSNRITYYFDVTINENETLTIKAEDGDTTL